MQLFKNWWLLAFRGVPVILLGLLALFAPEITLTVMMTYFGILLLIGGTFLLYGAYTHHNDNRHRRLRLTEGAIDLLLGILVIAYPTQSGSLLAIFLGVWAVMIGVVQIINANRIRRHQALYWAKGLIGILFGGILLFKPLEGVVAIMSVIGAFALILGVGMVLIAFRLKEIYEEEDGAFDEFDEIGG